MRSEKSKRTAIVTGAASGIGKAIAEKLCDENIGVFSVDISIPENEGKNFFQADVSKAEDIDQLFRFVSEKNSIPEILILNAGRGIQEKLTEGDPEKWQKIINVNIMGALRCIRAFVPQMLKNKNPQVIFISSVSANQPHPYGGIYSASKTAIEIIAETLRLENHPHLKVSVVSPGIVDTNFFENQVSGNNSVEEMGMGAISAEEIAEDIWYILNKKNGTSINKIITRPLKQTF